jgi:Flp pilus assembly protein TadG
LGLPFARIRTARGQSLTEFALILPLLFLLIINVVNLGGMFFAWIAVADGARAGAQYWITGGSSAGGPSHPNQGTVATFINEDLHRLPNSTSVSVCVCLNNKGTITCKKDSSTTCTPPGGNPPADPETTTPFALGSVDVTYTYVPYISLWDFSKLGVHLTIPPTNIHRQVLMRAEW